MWNRMSGKSSNTKEKAPSEAIRHSDDTDRSKRTRSNSTTSSNTNQRYITKDEDQCSRRSKKTLSRGDDRDRGFNPTSSSYSSTSQSPYPGTASASVATASGNHNNDTFIPPDLMRNASLADQMPKSRSLRNERKRDEDLGSTPERRRTRNGTGDEKERDRDDRRREKEARFDEKGKSSTKGLNKSSRDGKNYRGIDGMESTRGPADFPSQIGANGFSQFPGQYEGSLPHAKSDPQDHPMSSHVQDQFPGQFPDQSTAPYRPPGPGLAAEYYGDAGESVAEQPGNRANTPSLIIGAEPHLQPALAVAAPPPEPSASGGVGAAASFFSGDFDGDEAASTLDQHSSSTYSTAQVRPSGSHHSSSAPAIPTISGAALGAAAGYFVGNQTSSHTQRPNHYPSVGVNQGGYVSSTHHRPPSPTAESYYSHASRPSRPSQHSAHSVHIPMHAAETLVGAATAASAYHQSQHPSSPRFSPRPHQITTSMARKHRHRGPLGAVVDFFKDPEGVAEFEEYSEITGICRYCFAPGSSPRDAPRRHYYRKRRLMEGIGKVDKDSRYYSSENDGRRKKNKSWLVTGLAGYGLAKVGETLFNQTDDFDDTYSVKTGQYFPERSKNKSRGRSNETGIIDDGILYRKESPGNFLPNSTMTSSKTRRRTRSRSRSKSRKTYLADATVTTTMGSSLARSSSQRERSVSLRGASSKTRHRKGEGSPKGHHKSYREKKGRGFFSLESASSSSSSVNLNHGSYWHNSNKRVSTKSKDDKKAEAALLGLGAAAAALALNENRHKSNKKGVKKLVGVKETLETPSQGHKYGVVSDDEVWESAPEEEHESADSGLAYGAPRRRGSRESLSSESSGTEKWSWRWGSKNRRNLPQRRPSDHVITPTIAAGAGTDLIEGSAILSNQYHGSVVNSTAGLPLQHVFPIPTSDPTRFDVGREGPVTVSSSQGIAAIQHPQPITPVSTALYSTHAPLEHTYSAPVIPSAFSAQEHPSATTAVDARQHKREISNPNGFDRDSPLGKGTERDSKLRRRDSSPAEIEKSDLSMYEIPHRGTTTRNDASVVRFDRTEEQEENDRRERRRKRREDRERWEAEQQEQIEGDRRTSSEKTKPRSDSYKEADRESRRSSANMWAAPAAVGVVGAVVGAAAIAEQSKSEESREERRERRRREREREEAEDEEVVKRRERRRRKRELEEAPKTAELSAVKDRSVPDGNAKTPDDTGRPSGARESEKSIWQEAASPKKSTSHEDYGTFFRPLGLSDDQVKTTSADANANINFDQTPAIVTVAPKGFRDPDIQPVFSPADTDEQVDTSNLSVLIPKLRLVEPTPPSSRSSTPPVKQPDGSDGTIEASARDPAPAILSSQDEQDNDYIEPPLEEQSLELIKSNPSESDQGRSASPSHPPDGLTEQSHQEHALEDSNDLDSTAKPPNGEDIQFAATLAASAEDAGFDPSIILNDPEYSRRDSPPGINDRAMPGGFDEDDDSMLSKRERRRKERTDKLQNGSDTPNRRDDAAIVQGIISEVQNPQIQDAKEPIDRIEDDWGSSKKSKAKSKKSRRSSKSKDETFDTSDAVGGSREPGTNEIYESPAEDTTTIGTSVPTGNGAQTTKESSKKRKDDGAAFDAATSTVSLASNVSESEKSKSKSKVQPKGSAWDRILDRSRNSISQTDTTEGAVNEVEEPKKKGKKSKERKASRKGTEEDEMPARSRASNETLMERRSSADGAALDTGRITQDLPFKDQEVSLVETSKVDSSHVSGYYDEPTGNDAQRSESFLDMRPEPPPPPDTPIIGEEPPGIPEVSNFPATLPSPPEDPVPHYNEKYSTVPLSSPTAVPFDFRFSRPRPRSLIALGRSASQSTLPSAQSSGIQVSRPKTRPRSTEFTSSKEFKPLMLVERHNSHQDVAAEESYPSLPPSRASSQSSSVNFFEDGETGDKDQHEMHETTESVIEAQSPPISIDPEIPFSEFLSSQQATPTATSFQRPLEGQPLPSPSANRKVSPKPIDRDPMSTSPQTSAHTAIAAVIGGSAVSALNDLSRSNSATEPIFGGEVKDSHRGLSPMALDLNADGFDKEETVFEDRSAPADVTLSEVNPSPNEQRLFDDVGEVPPSSGAHQADVGSAVSKEYQTSAENTDLPAEELPYQNQGLLQVDTHDMVQDLQTDRVPIVPAIHEDHKNIPGGSDLPNEKFQQEEQTPLERTNEGVNLGTEANRVPENEPVPQDNAVLTKDHAPVNEAFKIDSSVYIELNQRQDQKVSAADLKWVDEEHFMGDENLNPEDNFAPQKSENGRENKQENDESSVSEDPVGLPATEDPKDCKSTTPRLLTPEETRRIEDQDAQDAVDSWFAPASSGKKEKKKKAQAFVDQVPDASQTPSEFVDISRPDTEPAQSEGSQTHRDPTIDGHSDQALDSMSPRAQGIDDATEDTPSSVSEAGVKFAESLLVRKQSKVKGKKGKKSRKSASQDVSTLTTTPENANAELSGWSTQSNQKGPDYSQPEAGFTHNVEKIGEISTDTPSGLQMSPSAIPLPLDDNVDLQNEDSLPPVIESHSHTYYTETEDLAGTPCNRALANTWPSQVLPEAPIQQKSGTPEDALSTPAETEREGEGPAAESRDIKPAILTKGTTPPPSQREHNPIALVPKSEPVDQAENRPRQENLIADEEWRGFSSKKKGKKGKKAREELRANTETSASKDLEQLSLPTAETEVIANNQVEDVGLPDTENLPQDQSKDGEDDWAGLSSKKKSNKGKKTRQEPRIEAHLRASIDIGPSQLPVAESGMDVDNQVENTARPDSKSLSQEEQSGKPEDDWARFSSRKKDKKGKKAREGSGTTVSQSTNAKKESPTLPVASPELVEDKEVDDLPRTNIADVLEEPENVEDDWGGSSSKKKSKKGKKTKAILMDNTPASGEAEAETPLDTKSNEDFRGGKIEVPTDSSRLISTQDDPEAPEDESAGFANKKKGKKDKKRKSKTQDLISEDLRPGETKPEAAEPELVEPESLPTDVQHDNDIESRYQPIPDAPMSPLQKIAPVLEAQKHQPPLDMDSAKAFPESPIAAQPWHDGDPMSRQEESTDSQELELIGRYGGDEDLPNEETVYPLADEVGERELDVINQYGNGETISTNPDAVDANLDTSQNTPDKAMAVDHTQNISDEKEAQSDTMGLGNQAVIGSQGQETVADVSDPKAEVAKAPFSTQDLNADKSLIDIESELDKKEDNGKESPVNDNLEPEDMESTKPPLSNDHLNDLHTSGELPTKLMDKNFNEKGSLSVDEGEAEVPRSGADFIDESSLEDSVAEQQLKEIPSRTGSEYGDGKEPDPEVSGVQEGADRDSDMIDAPKTLSTNAFFDNQILVAEHEHTPFLVEPAPKTGMKAPPDEDRLEDPPELGLQMYGEDDEEVQKAKPLAKVDGKVAAFDPANESLQSIGGPDFGHLDESVKHEPPGDAIEVDQTETKRTFEAEQHVTRGEDASPEQDPNQKLTENPQAKLRANAPSVVEDIITSEDSLKPSSSYQIPDFPTQESSNDTEGGLGNPIQPGDTTELTSVGPYDHGLKGREDEEDAVIRPVSLTQTSDANEDFSIPAQKYAADINQPRELDEYPTYSVKKSKKEKKNSKKSGTSTVNEAHIQLEPDNVIEESAIGEVEAGPSVSPVIEESKGDLPTDNQSTEKLEPNIAPELGKESLQTQNYYDTAMQKTPSAIQHDFDKKFAPEAEFAPSKASKKGKKSKRTKALAFELETDQSPEPNNSFPEIQGDHKSTVEETPMETKNDVDTTVASEVILSPFKESKKSKKSKKTKVSALEPEASQSLAEETSTSGKPRNIPGAVAPAQVPVSGIGESAANSIAQEITDDKAEDELWGAPVKKGKKNRKGQSKAPDNASIVDAAFERSLSNTNDPLEASLHTDPVTENQLLKFVTEDPVLTTSNVDLGVPQEQSDDLQTHVEELTKQGDDSQTSTNGQSPATSEVKVYNEQEQGNHGYEYTDHSKTEPLQVPPAFDMDSSAQVPRTVLSSSSQQREYDLDRAETEQRQAQTLTTPTAHPNSPTERERFDAEKSVDPEDRFTEDNMEKGHDASQSPTQNLPTPAAEVDMLDPQEQLEYEKEYAKELNRQLYPPQEEEATNIAGLPVHASQAPSTSERSDNPLVIVSHEERTPLARPPPLEAITEESSSRSNSLQGTTEKDDGSDLFKTSKKGKKNRKGKKQQQPVIWEDETATPSIENEADKAVKTLALPGSWEPEALDQPFSLEEHIEPRHTETENPTPASFVVSRSHDNTEDYFAIQPSRLAEEDVGQELEGNKPQRPLSIEPSTLAEEQQWTQETRNDLDEHLQHQTFDERNPLEESIDYSSLPSTYSAFPDEIVGDDYESVPIKKGKKSKKSKRRDTETLSSPSAFDSEQSLIQPRASTTERIENESVTKDQLPSQASYQEEASFSKEPMSDKTQAPTKRFSGPAITAGVGAAAMMTESLSARDSKKLGKKGKKAKKTKWADLEDETPTSPNMQTGDETVIESTEQEHPHEQQKLEKKQEDQQTTPLYHPVAPAAYDSTVSQGISDPPPPPQSESSRYRDSAINIIDSPKESDEGPVHHAIRDSGYPETESSPITKPGQEPYDMQTESYSIDSPTVEKPQERTEYEQIHETLERRSPSLDLPPTTTVGADHTMSSITMSESQQDDIQNERQGLDFPRNEEDREIPGYDQSYQTLEPERSIVDQPPTTPIKDYPSLDALASEPWERRKRSKSYDSDDSADSGFDIQRRRRQGRSKGAREPSPVSSSTKDRSSVLFNSSPSVREEVDGRPDTHNVYSGQEPTWSFDHGEKGQGKARDTSDYTSLPDTSSESTQNSTNEELSSHHEAKPESLFGGPVRHDEDFSTGSRSPQGGENRGRRRRLNTISETSQERSSLHTKDKRAISDVGSPETGVKGRRVRSPTAKDDIASYMTTESLSSNLTQPTLPIEDDTVKSGRSRNHNTDPSSGEYSALSNLPLVLPQQQRDGEYRTASAASMHSENSVRAFIRTPEQVRSSSGQSYRSSGTPPLRRVDRSASGDLRGASKLDQSKTSSRSRAQSSETHLDSDNAINSIPSSSTYDPVTDKGKSRAEMADVYEGWGDVRGQSPMSPTRPPSMRKRQSMQLLDLEARLDQLVSENRLLQNQKSNAERTLQDQTRDHSEQRHAYEEALQQHKIYLAQKDSELDGLRKTVEGWQEKVNQLNEVNEELVSSCALDDEHEQRYKELEAEHSHLRDRHTELTSGMETLVQREVASHLQAKDSELQRLREELESAKQQVRNLQQQLLVARQSDDFVERDEDYFDSQCQSLCQHVQQWVLRFSKFSDMKACYRASEIRDETKVDRMENAILDGTDIDIYLQDRVKRRDIFMAVVMTMIFDYIFTRYLFGMDREQRQKLKNLEKTLQEIGPVSAVCKWRATTLTLLMKREDFSRQRATDTEAIVHEIYDTLATFLPPPSHLINQIQDSLRKVINTAADLSIEMRTQRADYQMLPPLQPEFDTNGDLARKVHFNALTMNERSGATISNQALQEQGAVVRMVLFPLVVKNEEDDEQIIVCPAQVLTANSKGKKTVRVMSVQGSAQGARSEASFVGSDAYMEGGMI